MVDDLVLLPEVVLPETIEALSKQDWARRRAVHRALKNYLANELGFTKLTLQQMVSDEVIRATKALVNNVGSLNQFIENRVLSTALRCYHKEVQDNLEKKMDECVAAAVRALVNGQLRDRLDIKISVRAKPKPKGARRAVKKKQEYWPAEG